MPKITYKNPSMKHIQDISLLVLMLIALVLACYGFLVIYRQEIEGDTTTFDCAKIEIKDKEFSIKKCN